MSIRDYPGFKWSLFVKANEDVYDTWKSLFFDANIVSIEGNFYSYIAYERGHVMHETIHDAMDYIRHKAIIKYFDEN